MIRRVLSRWMRSTLTTRLLLTSAVGLVAAVLILSVVNYFGSRATIEGSEENRLLLAYQGFNDYIESQSDRATALAYSTARIPAIQAAFAQGDRELLVDEVLPVFETLREQFGVVQAQFHLPPATSFLRLHDLEHYGDDLSSFRFTVLDVNREQTALGGIEIGRGGPGIRGVVPIQFAGRHVGSFEVGVNVNQASLLHLQSLYGGDWHIFLDSNASSIATLEDFQVTDPGPVSGLLWFAGTTESFLLISETSFQRVLTRQETVIDRLQSDNAAYAVLTAPLKDYRGDVVGVVQYQLSRTGVLSQLQDAGLRSVVIGLSLIAVLLGVLYFIIRRAFKPIVELTETATAIAAGDLHRTAAVTSDDEIGLLAQSFNAMTGQLRQLIAELEKRVAASDAATELAEENARLKSDMLSSMSHQLIRALNAATAEIQAATQQQAASVSEQNAAVTQTAATVEEVRATVQQTADHARAISKVAEASTEVSSRGETAVAATVEGMNRIRQRVEAIAETILTLSHRTQAIGNIISTVNDIADQSKLLALNASIEAARAGEEGRGFAVVASEVRVLAEQSRQATASIGAILHEIQQATNTAVMVTEEGTKEADRGLELVNNAGDSIRELAATLQEATKSVSQIAASTFQQSNGMNQLVVAMQQIRTASSQSKESARQIEENVRQLLEMSHQLEASASAG